MMDLPPTYSDEQWAAFCAGTWQKEIARLTRERDEARQALARLRAEFTDCCACRANEAGDIQVWCRAHADIRDECDRLRALLREVEWGSYSEFGASCPCCHGMDPDDDSNPYANHQVGHSATCELKAALEGR